MLEFMIYKLMSHSEREHLSPQIGQRCSRPIDDMWYEGTVYDVSPDRKTVSIVYDDDLKAESDVDFNLEGVRFYPNVNNEYGTYDADAYFVTDSAESLDSSIYSSIYSSVDSSATISHPKIALSPSDKPLLTSTDDFSLNIINNLITAHPTTRDRLKSFDLTSHVSNKQEIVYKEANLLPLAGRCQKCSKHTIFRCNSCSTVFYCSRYCQRKSWRKHSIVCGGKSDAVATPVSEEESKAAVNGMGEEEYTDPEWSGRNDNGNKLGRSNVDGTDTAGRRMKRSTSGDSMEALADDEDLYSTGSLKLQDPAAMVAGNGHLRLDQDEVDKFPWASIGDSNGANAYAYDHEWEGLSQGSKRPNSPTSVSIAHAVAVSSASVGVYPSAQLGSDDDYARLIHSIDAVAGARSLPLQCNECGTGGTGGSLNIVPPESCYPYDSDIPDLVDVIPNQNILTGSSYHYNNDKSSSSSDNYLSSSTAFHNYNTPPKSNGNDKASPRISLYDDKIPDILEVLPISEENARKALVRFYGDTERALDYLLSSVEDFSIDNEVPFSSDTSYKSGCSLTPLHDVD